MCGKVGFTGRQQAAPILINGLSKLEYRGYDGSMIFSVVTQMEDNTKHLFLLFQTKKDIQRYPQFE